MQERNAYGGVPLGRTYWSTHRPGKRKPVKHVQNAGTSFFAYLNGAGAAGGDGGESLTHQLFKEALEGLSCTKLKLGTLGEHEITITHGEAEKEIRTVDGLYYADVYWRFTATSSLGLKWSGEMYLEVHHTHAVPRIKQDSLRAARLPVIEVDIPPTLEYQYEDEDTTDPREAAYVSRIRHVLQTGFLAGRVISDPSSIEYLEQEVAKLEQELRKAQQNWSAAKQRGDAASQQLAVVSGKEASLRRIVAGLTQQKEQAIALATKDGRDLVAAKKEVSRLSELLSTTTTTVEVQQKKICRTYWLVYGMAALVAVMGVALLVQRFAVPQEEQGRASQAVPTLLPQKATASGTGKTQKAQSESSSRRHKDSP